MGYDVGGLQTGQARPGHIEVMLGHLILAQRREGLQAERLLVGVVVAAQQLVSADGGGLDTQLG